MLIGSQKFLSKSSKVGKIDSNKRSRIRGKVSESCNQTGGKELSRRRLDRWWCIHNHKGVKQELELNGAIATCKNVIDSFQQLAHAAALAEMLRNKRPDVLSHPVGIISI